MSSRTRTRPYHSPLRQEQSAATRERILDACAEVMRTGRDLTYGAVAAQARVQERTVYRHFPTKTDLEAGLWRWILDNVTHVDFGAARTPEELVSAMRGSFVGFDDDAPLVQAMLHSRQGLEVRIGQQPERRAMFEACARSAIPEATLPVRRDVAAALQVLYSASSWELLRAFWGMDGARAAEVIELAMRSLLAGAKGSVAGGRTERAPPKRTRHAREGTPRARARRAGNRRLEEEP